MAYDITIDSGDSLINQYWDSGECIIVAAGATISNSEITYRADSLTLREGAVVSGTLTVAAPVTVEGTISASEADLVFDISKRKEEQGLLWSDISAAEANSYTVVVSPNQNKGTYRIAGNAAAFNGTITIQNTGGVILGTLSANSSVLDFDITRYTLAKNSDGELTVSISSNITDDSYYVFLYKNNQLDTPLEDAFGYEVSGTGTYDHIVIIENGIAGDISLLDNGVMTVYAGGAAVGVKQASRGKLRFDYAEGDATIISGDNQYGSFLVQDNYLLNVVGETVNLSGNVFVEDYHSLGVFTSIDGVDISGVFVSNSTAYFKNATHIHDCSVSGSNLYFEKGVTVTDSSISNARFNGGTFTNVTIGGGDFFGGSFGDVILTNGGTVCGYISLHGTLTIENGDFLKSPWYPGYIDANGNTIVLNFTRRKRTQGEILTGNYVSEDVYFCIDLLVDQSIGTYQVLGSTDTVRKEYSFTIRTDEGVLGTLTETNTSFEYGNYIYTMTSGKELVIDLSPNADETFNVLYWDADDTFYHSVDLFYATVSASDYKEVIVRTNGIVGDLLLEGGLLELQRDSFAVGIEHRNNASLRFDYSAGDMTIITGANQYGTFLVQDDLLLNVIGESVNLKGNLSVVDYRATLNVTAVDGVAFTGTLHLGSNRDNISVIGWQSKAEDEVIADVTITNANVTGSYYNFWNGVTVTDSYIASGGNFRGGTYIDTTFAGGTYYGGTYSDVIWQGGTLGSGATVQLAGTLTITGVISMAWNANIKANYNTIVLDYTRRTVADGALISVNRISEDVVFEIALLEDQNVGTYTICNDVGSFIDVFNISIDGDIIGTVNRDNNSFENGNYVYTMLHDVEKQILQLKIDVSENADERFNVLCYDSTEFLTYAPEFTTITINGTDVAKVVVRNGGWLADTELDNGLLTVRSGAVVYGLKQSANGKLRFNYTEGDDTIITGVNQYGTFLVENNEIVNVKGENVTVTGDVVIRDYHSAGTFSATGVTVTDNFYGNGTFSDSTINNAVISGTATVNGGSIVTDSVVSSANFSTGTYENVTVTGSAELHGGTYCETVLKKGGLICGRIVLDGRFTTRGVVECYESYSVNGAIDAFGYEVNLDLTGRSPIDGAMINVNRVYNADLTVTVYSDQTIGTYTLGSKAEKFGQGDSKGYWDIDTNTWLYKGAVEGDLDGIITIRSELGITLANCTVNGDTEYFGRYNYRVYTDEENQLQLTIGWNNRENLSFAPDGYDNDLREKATQLEGTSGKLNSLTIDSKTDVDWFQFTMDVPGRSASSISIDFDMWKGDLDIYLYDEKGNLVDYAKSVTDNEELSLHKLAAGNYYLKVEGYEGNTNEYTLNWNLPHISTLKDDYEAGNNKAHSYHLGKIEGEVVVNGAISDANDEDWFMFILNDDGTSADSISITFDDAEADLEFYIYGSNGKDLIGRGVKHRGHKYCKDDDCHHRKHHHHDHIGGRPEDFEYSDEELYFTQDEISLAGFKHGVYYVRIVSADGGAVDYTLNANILSGEVSPDKWESKGNNNTLKKASDLYSINGEYTIGDLSIHSGSDEDFFRFTILEDGSADDSISISYEVKYGDLDIEILDRNGDVVAYSRTAENTDTVSLNGLAAGNYYIRVYGYENTVNNYSLSYKFTNSSLIPADRYETHEPLLIAQSQTIKDLSIAKDNPKRDETRADVYKISLDYDAWDSTKIILTDFRSDWDGLRYTLSTDAAGKEVIASGISSEISLAGLKKGDYYLTLDTPVENQYSKYSFISQHIPDSTIEIENNWSIFIYIAGDNNLEGAYLQELLYMQHAILPEDVEVYVLMDRTPGWYVAERNWSDTRVGKIRHSPGGAVAVEWMYFDGVNTDTYVTTQNLELQQEWDTGDITTLEAFLDWGMQTGRADNYALIMKDHGSSLGWNTEDETSGSMMHITEIADLLKQEKYDDLSVVTFDQCLMGSDVVITEMENAVEYTVASEAVGWTPNLLVMYKVLFNSLETDMTPEELAGKIVASSNCSGRQNLTLASFDTSDTYLSTALNEFASHASEFTYADWAAVCNSFGTAFNYGDDICAFSDIISILENTLTFTISDTLSSAVNELMISLKDEVIKATMITPAAYGNGLAVFNPVLSSDNMSMYAYTGGGALDYYGSKIGQMAWGDFLFTVGALAEDVSHYITEAVGELTFTDFSYFFGEEQKEIMVNLGAFSGNGMTLDGLYVGETAWFTIEMLQQGIDGDAICIVADDPEADITISLIQQRPTMAGIELITRRISENGVLSLAGVDFENAGVLSDYILTITSDKATRYKMSFEGDWASGVDFFDYSRTGTIDSSRGGNNILDKATKLAAGNYGGLMTYAGDADFYQLNTVYADTLTVTISGSDLVVKEYDAEGNVIQVAEYSDGVYSLKVTNGNYLYVEGNTNPAFNNVNSYTLKVSDVESTFVAAEGAGSIELPTIEIAGNQDDGWTQQGTVTATVSEGATAYYSTDMVTWYELQDNTLDTSVNNRYYFRAVSQTGISKYSSVEFANIDSVAPELTGISAESAAEGLLYKLTGADDNLLAGFEYRLDNGDWQQYDSDGVLVTGNTIVDFRAVDAAGNTSEIITRQAVGSVAGDVYGNVGDNGVTIDFSGASSVSGKVYGAGKNTSVSGDINFNAVGGDFDGYVCAGTTADDGEMYQIKGDINMSVANAVLNNGSKSRIYAAGEVSGGSLVRVRGDVNITLENLSVGNMTFGGAKVSEDSEFLLNGSINMNISGGSFGGNLFAGGAVVQNGGSYTISNDVNIVIDGGTFKNIGSGIQCQLGSSAVIRGNTSLTINSGIFNGIVFAGAYSQGGTASVGGNSTLIINGGTFKSSIYGGSFAGTYNNGSQNGSIKTTVGGDTIVRIDATDSVISFAAREAIYAGSVDYGVVAGNTNVIVSGKGENLIFGEKFTVMGDSIEYQRAGITYIGGNKNMSFDAFTGRFDAQLYAFTHLNIINGSSVEFGVAQNYLGDVSNWKIDLKEVDTALIWESGRNDFAGDTLDLSFDDALESATIIDGNQRSVINGWDKLDSIIFNGVSGAWSAEYMAWVDSENKWKVFADDNNDLVIAKLA